MVKSYSALKELAFRSLEANLRIGFNNDIKHKVCYGMEFLKKDHFLEERNNQPFQCMKQ